MTRQSLIGTIPVRGRDSDCGMAPQWDTGENMDFEQLQKQSDLVFNSLMNEADSDPVEALRMFHMGEFIIDNGEVRDFIEELLLELADEEQ